MNRRLLKSMFERMGGSCPSFNSTLHKTAPVLVASALVFSAGAQAADPQGLSLSASQPQQVALVAPNVRSSDMYIVQLEAPAVATYHGGIAGFAPTSAKTNATQKMDSKSEAVEKYADRLQRVQAEMLDTAGSVMGRALTPKFSYQHAINGFAVQMSRNEAKTMRKMAGVKDVQRERIEYTLTDQGPELIRAQRIWRNGNRSSRGEGLVIAVLDSGINSDHPSFAAVSGDGYQHENPLGSGNFLPGSYCDTVDPSFCNDKLIGAWDFTDIDGTVPEDDDGHGSHTASTAAGNVVLGAQIEAPTATTSFDITGVAPRANIIAYDVCQRTCSGAALIAAIDQVVIDAGNLPNGITALNYSISGGGDPYNDPVELGFLAAVESGVYVAASGGNSGPDAGTVAHLGPWVSTTAASTHTREIPNTLGSLTSDADTTADLKGLGFTAAYGPAKIVNSADYEADFPGATLCGVGESGAEGGTSPFPAGTFNGEIVACTRGAYGRVEKGANVLSAGAGGYVLMDTGGGVVGDPHVLPGVHISEADGQILSEWLAANKDSNPTATISGFSIVSNPDLADVMAGFSSRGPNQALSVLKPDVTAPGVSILAAVATTEGSVQPEYGFRSGTSMSSPHNAGAGALLSASRPNWTPQEIKSAIMLTAVNRGPTKEDGVTSTDPFDLGAGRIQLGKADRSGLIMNETIGNFRAANPEEGGDPKTLNLASVMDSNCVGTCTWTRTVTNTLERTGYWNVTAGGDGFDAEVSILPPSKNRNYNLKLRRGQSAKITVTANNYGAAPGWKFGAIRIDAKQNQVNDDDFDYRNGYGYGYNDLGYAYKKPRPNVKHRFSLAERRQKYIDRLKKAYARPSGPDLKMPMAVQAASSTNSSVFNKSVDTERATAGDTLTYGLTATNGQITGPITVTDILPAGTTFVEGSASETVTLGTTDSPLSYDSETNTVSWTGELDAGELLVADSPSPFGYFSLGDFGTEPTVSDCNGDCDDGGFFFTVPAFTFNGVSYSEVLVSINGTIEAGSDSGRFVSASNTELPDVATPNNLLAPLWRDLDLSSGGNFYIATLSAGTSTWTIYEWEDVPHFSDTPGPTVPAVTMQVWVGVDGTDTEGDIHYVYNRLDDTSNATVGAENDTGTVGSTYFFEGAGTAPVAGTDLAVTPVQGGQAELGFQVVTDCSEELVINRASMSATDVSERAIAVTECK